MKPAAAAKDLNWPGTLALEVLTSGEAEIRCGNERVILKFVDPARMEVTFDGIGGATKQGHPLIPLGDEPFLARAILLDPRGMELETGKFTAIEWTVSGNVEVVRNHSAAEFGLCDTCFGMQRFRLTSPGPALIGARLRELVAEAVVEVEAPSV
jgi:hypothetical protein